MISHKYKTIFIHQRKAAGTSVFAMFEDGDRTMYNNGLLSPYWDDDDETVRSYYKFTVIRNPYDRLVSGWKYCRSTRNLPLRDVVRNLPQQNLLQSVFAPDASMRSRLTYGREWLRGTAARAKTAQERLLTPSRVKRRAGPSHDYWHLTLPQHALVVRADGSLAVDRVVFFERLNEGMTTVLSDVGAPPVDVPHKRSGTARRSYRDYFDDEARVLFERRFEKELSIWKYDFDTGLPATDAASIGSLSELG